jgi:hypothetical protein
VHGHVPAQGVAPDDRASDVEGIEEADDVAAQLVDRRRGQPRIEDGQGQRHGPTVARQRLD